MTDENEADPTDGHLDLGTLADAKRNLQNFFDRHANSEIATISYRERETIAVLSPWGDETLITILPEDPNEAYKLLNSVYLPESLSGIWHMDSKDLEVIWTAYKLEESQQVIADRTFDFHYKKKTYHCEFGDSSAELVGLADMTRARSNPSHTNFRNLPSFMQFADEGPDEDASLDKPRSFWIRDLDLEESEALDLIRTLNFYLSYYDSASPTVLIHPTSSDAVEPRQRYVHGGFPDQIRASDLDANLLQSWQAARQESAFLQFILYYRVIEYVATHYLEAGMRERIKRLIGDPSALSMTDKVTSRIIEEFQTSALDDVPRFNSLLTKAVDPALVWAEIDRHREFFESPTVFEGEFQLGALIHKGETLDKWRNQGLERFGNKIRQLRNVLAHGKDQTSAKTIVPTARNGHSLKRWNDLIAIAAGEVIVYDGVV